MHTSYAPEMLNEDEIENACDDLRACLVNVWRNDGDLDDYDRACAQMKHISAMLDTMIPDEADED